MLSSEVLEEWPRLGRSCMVEGSGRFRLSLGWPSVGRVGGTGDEGRGGMMMSGPLNLTPFEVEMLRLCVHGKPTILLPEVPRSAIDSRCWSTDGGCSGALVTNRRGLGFAGR